jgi:MFS family permease
LAAFRALRHRNFRLFFMGQTTSLVGTWMQNVALTWLVYRLSHSELLLGFTGFLTHLPTLILGPVGGVVADRVDRRKIVILCQALFLLQAVLLAGLTLTGRVTVAHVMGLAFFQGLVDAFDRPARQSLLVHLAGREDLLNAVSLNSLMYNTARVIGPSIGGVMVAAFGEGICFSVNSLSFLAVLGSLFLVTAPPAEPSSDSSALAHLKEGFRYVSQEAHARRMLLLNGVVNLAVAPIWVVLPHFADSVFHRGSSGVGFLTASMGLGAVVGMLGLAARTTTVGLRSLAFWSVLLLGGAMAAFAFSPLFALSAAMMALLGFSVMRMNGATNTELQSRVPEALRGRVMGFFAMANVGVLPLGSLGGGALAETVGASWVVLGGGLICILAAVVFRWREAS